MSERTIWDAQEGDKLMIDEDREIVTVTDNYGDSIRYYDDEGIAFRVRIKELIERNAEFVGREKK